MESQDDGSECGEEHSAWQAAGGCSPAGNKNLRTGTRLEFVQATVAWFLQNPPRNVFIIVKLSSVLTLFVLIGGLLGASGCVQQRMSRALEPVQSTLPTASSELTTQPAEPALITNLVSEAPAPEPAKEAPILEPPPLPQVEIVGPAPSRNHVWQPGHWVWNDGWQWISGHWTEAPERDAAWIPGRWVNRDGAGWVWTEGHWRVASLN